MFKFPYLTAILALSPLAFAADLKPTLQWVTTAGTGPGTNSAVAGAVADAQGNLYIAGSTSAFDLTRISALPRSSTDAFVLKLDRNGAAVYASYIGGSNTDAAVAIALGPGGSVYITGTTTSIDFPTTTGAYMTQRATPDSTQLSFVAKLDASGTVSWATYFPERNIDSIAADASGNAYIGGWTTGGGSLPTTPGAYNTTFKQTIGSNGFFGTFGPTSAFVTKLNPEGSGLIYSTYVPTDNNGLAVQEASALTVDAAGNAWIGNGRGNSLATGSFVQPTVVELNPTGSAVVASAGSVSIGPVASITLDKDANVYVAGTFTSSSGFPATPGAFQAFPQPLMPRIPGQPVSGGGSDAFVAKWDPALKTLLAATLLGGEAPDSATSVAVDASGNVLVGGYTDSKAFPTRTPFQTSFSSHSGFAAAFDATLSNLVFSTYAGDSRPFVAKSVLPDGSGGILLAGSTAIPPPVTSGDFISPHSSRDFVIANRISLSPAQAPRIDSVQHYVSRLANPLAPGEPIIVTGSGFSPDARILLDGSPLPPVNGNATFLVGVVPDSAPVAGIQGSGAHNVQISNNGTLSNLVVVPAAIASPGIYTSDGNIVGEAYALNSDGTRNSAANPAAPGTAITIFAAGAGPFARVGPYAVTALQPAVFVDGFYCNGIAATMESVDGLPGNVFKLSVIIPSYAELIRNNPDLKNFRFGERSSLQLFMGAREAGRSSQGGVYINIK